MPYDNASGHYILRFYDWAGPYLTLNLDSLISRPVHAFCYFMRFFHDPAQHNENEQKPRKHGICAF